MANYPAQPAGLCSNNSSYEGCRLFLLGEHAQAMDRKGIYEETTELWVEAEIIEGYYCASSEEQK